MEKKTFKEVVLEKEKEGKVVIMTMDGLMEAPLDDFIKQPTEGLLYDLNHDCVTILAWLEKDEVRRVNDYAAMLVITKLKEYYDKQFESWDAGISVGTK